MASRAGWRRYRWPALAAAVLGCILAPFVVWGSQIEAWAAGALHHGAAPGPAAALIVALLAVDIVAPVPSSLVSTASGSILGAVPGTAASWLGMTISTWLGYWLGRRTAAGVGSRWVGGTELKHASDVTGRMGIWALGVFRGVPVLAEATVFFAGLTGTPLAPFAAVTTLANAAVSACYAWAGAAGMRGGAYAILIVGAIAAPALGTALARRGTSVNRRDAADRR